MANGRRLATAAPIALREDFDAVAPRALARRAADSGQVRRLLALATIYDGGGRRLKWPGPIGRPADAREERHHGHAHANLGNHDRQGDETLVGGVA